MQKSLSFRLKYLTTVAPTESFRAYGTVFVSLANTYQFCIYCSQSGMVVGC